MHGFQPFSYFWWLSCPLGYYYDFASLSGIGCLIIIYYTTITAMQLGFLVVLSWLLPAIPPLPPCQGHQHMILRFSPTGCACDGSPRVWLLEGPETPTLLEGLSPGRFPDGQKNSLT